MYYIWKTEKWFIHISKDNLENLTPAIEITKEKVDYLLRDRNWDENKKAIEEYYKNLIDNF